MKFFVLMGVWCCGQESIMQLARISGLYKGRWRNMGSGHTCSAQLPWTGALHCLSNLEEPGPVPDCPLPWTTGTDQGSTNPDKPNAHHPISSSILTAVVQIRTSVPLPYQPVFQSSLYRHCCTRACVVLVIIELLTLRRS